MGKARDIRKAVEEALGRDRIVDAVGITVINVKGSVALNGTVPSYPQYLQAAETARNVAGVTGVHNHLQVELPPEAHRDDAMLTTAANNALAASALVPGEIEATAKDGNLTLTGPVKYGSQREAAESAVSGLTGVRYVKDETDLVFDVDPGEVNRLVSEALRNAPAPRDDSDVTATATGNTVMLSGRVRTQAQRDAVVSAAWRGHAVMAVIDAALEITG
jgi:osmotically-inducible protein OsmY